MFYPPVNGKIQGLFKAFECFSSTFKGKFNFQGLFKTVLYIQVLFKPVRTLLSQSMQNNSCIPISVLVEVVIKVCVSRFARLVLVAIELPGTVMDLVILVVDVPMEAVVLTTGTVIDF